MTRANLKRSQILKHLSQFCVIILLTFKINVLIDTKVFKFYLLRKIFTT